MSTGTGAGNGTSNGNGSSTGSGSGPGNGGASLELQHISKHFAGVNALSDVSVTLRPGEVTAIIGENGAGKSTLLKILGGDYAPDGGQVVLDGTPLHLRSPRDANRRGIRIIPQEPEIVPDVSVAENVYLGTLPRRGVRVLDRGALHRQVTEDIRRLGFEQVLNADTIGRHLSAAGRQLVELLRALHGEARVVAFDEPTSSLTEREVDLLFRLIKRLREDGLAIAYVSHRLNEVFEITDRIVVLRDGRFVAERATAGASEPELVRLMVGRDLSAVFEREAVTGGRPVLEVRDVTTDDVRDISLTVHAGEVVALAGLVGAGRSELARAIVGDLPLRSGEILVDGTPLRSRQPKGAIRAGIGFAPEERKADALFMERTVRDNISLVVLNQLRRFRFVRRAAERQLAEQFTTRLRVRTPSLEQIIKNLSGGNQQKVVLARWLARRPKVLILDEPTRGIDVGAKAEIYRIIADLAHDGIALLVISSELPEVLGLADRIIVIKDGHITGELTRAEATEEKILSLAISEDLAGAPAGGDQ
jgi:L-arabinose transport system ATP-binding protein